MIYRLVMSNEEEPLENAFGWCLSSSSLILCLYGELLKGCSSDLVLQFHKVGKLARYPLKEKRMAKIESAKAKISKF